FRPEVALARLLLAEIVLGGGGPLSPDNGGTSADGPEAERNLDEAREHLAFALAEFEAMDMQPALARARRLQAVLAGAAAAATRTEMAADEATAPPAVRAGQVFISYSSHDRPIAF